MNFSFFFSFSFLGLRIPLNFFSLNKQTLDHGVVIFSSIKTAKNEDASSTIYYT